MFEPGFVVMKRCSYIRHIRHWVSGQITEFVFANTRIKGLHMQNVYKNSYIISSTVY